MPVAAAVIAVAMSLSLQGAADAVRAARSVHLWYPAPEATVFYNQLTVEQSQPGCYFMACGFRNGYFGIQQLADGRKVVLFSVWDPGEQDDPNVVPDEKRVELILKADDVRVGRFGNEGTGGQSFLDFEWEVGKTYHFAVRSEVSGEKTAYSGYLYLDDDAQWKHLVTFRRTTGGENLGGLYSFIEDFRRDGKSPTEVRRARFGIGWVHTTDGQWRPLAEVRFTADGNPLMNIDAGKTASEFFLQTGGDTENRTPLRSTLSHTAGDAPPQLLQSLPRPK